MARRLESSGLAERVELVVATISGLIVLGVIALLVHDGLSRDSPPRLEVARAHFDAVAGRLDFAVRNTGDTAASAVVVTAVTRGPDGAVAERRSLTIEHVPPGSEATGAFVLDAPAEVVVDGYLDP